MPSSNVRSTDLDVLLALLRSSDHPLTTAELVDALRKALAR